MERGLERGVTRVLCDPAKRREGPAREHLRELWPVLILPLAFRQTGRAFRTSFDELGPQRADNVCRRRSDGVEHVVDVSEYRLRGDRGERGLEVRERVRSLIRTRAEQFNKPRMRERAGAQVIGHHAERTAPWGR